MGRRSASDGKKEEEKKKTTEKSDSGNETGKPKGQQFKCANKKCSKILDTPPADDIRGRIVQVVCTSCETSNFLQYHCWACATPLDGIDYKKEGVQGQCPECGAFNPAKKPRVKDSCDDTSNRVVDKIMYGFTAAIQPYCVYSQLVWIYPHVLESMGAQGSLLEKVLYGITLFVSAGTLFNYWTGVFTKVKLPNTPSRAEVKLRSDPASVDRLDVNRWHFCQQCNAPRAPRDHHCNICNTCVPVMDHHCPFYGGACVGRHNHRNFILFLLFMMMTTVWLSFSTLCFFQHLPGFPSHIFKRDFSRQIMQECQGGGPFCPLRYVWSLEEVSMFGVVVIQLLLTILTLFLVSVLFQQQVTDLMENRTRLENIIIKSKKKKKEAARQAALAAGKEFTEDEEDNDDDDDLGGAGDDAEGNYWGELRDVCGPGHSLWAWILTPYKGTLPSKVRVAPKPRLSKKEE